MLWSIGLTESKFYFNIERNFAVKSVLRVISLQKDSCIITMDGAMKLHRCRNRGARGATN